MTEISQFDFLAEGIETLAQVSRVEARNWASRLLGDLKNPHNAVHNTTTSELLAITVVGPIARGDHVLYSRLENRLCQLVESRFWEMGSDESSRANRMMGWLDVKSRWAEMEDS